MQKRFLGKPIVITGSTSGIGLAAAQALTSAGAFVIGVGRNQSRIEKAKQAILSDCPAAQIEFVLGDLSSQDQVKAIAEGIKSALNQINLDKLTGLIHSAGVYLEKKHDTEDGIEMTFAVNHLAPFFLTHELLPLLINTYRGKVICVSSYSHVTTALNLNRITHPKPYLGLLAYKRSKLCNVLFTYEMNRRYPELASFAVDPGLVNTSIASKGSRGISHWVWKSRRTKGMSPDVPARTILYLALEDKINPMDGCYIKNCEPITPSRKAQSEELAKKLWQYSCQLTQTIW
jgi:NAD(P)-dependent dehydrogenase (short-subunit alcohol dehydrogenase family)